MRGAVAFLVAAGVSGLFWVGFRGRLGEPRRSVWAALFGLAVADFALGLWIGPLGWALGLGGIVLALSPRRVAVLALLVLALSGALWVAGARIEIVKVPFKPAFAELGPFGPPLSILWLSGVAWAVGSTSRVGGLTLPFVFLTSTAFLLICLLQPQQAGEAPLLALATMGAVAPPLFSRGERPPCPPGPALALGLQIGAVSVVGAIKNSVFLVLLVPLLLLSVPLFDMAYAVVYRGRDGRGTLAVSRRRVALYEALRARGLGEPHIRALLLAATAYAAAVAVVLVAMIRVHFTVKVAVLGALGGAGLLVFWALSKILSIPPGRRGRVRVLGIPVDAITMEEAVGRVFEFVKEGRPHMVVTPDASALVRAQEDEELRRIMEEADLVIPDGVGVVFAGRLLDLPLVERVPGVELAERVCEVASREGLRIFLLGAEPGVAEEAARRLTERFPGLRVVGTYHGYFSPEEEREVVERIKRARPDILFVAMGVPKQEKWMRRHLAELGVPVCIGVGGTLDVFAGRVKRAPLWVRRIGLEWLYRTLLQPRKRARRLLAIPRLLGMVLTFRRIKAKEDKPSQKGVEKG